MRHVYLCPTRWADLDLLGHVNNVVYVDYLQEARVDLMRAVFGGIRDDLSEGVVVVRHEVTYLSPLEFRFQHISIEVWVTEIRAATFTMAYEIFEEQADGSRTVFLRATTLLTPYVFATERPRRLTPGEKEALAPYVEAPFGEPTARIPSLDRARAHHFPLHVRFSDVDVYRHVNNVKYFEYFQESRLRQMEDLARGAGRTRPTVVVAQTDVDYRLPIVLRREPYDVWAGIIAVGSRSMTIESEIGDGDLVLARSRVTLVFFDPVAKRSTRPPEDLRSLLLDAMVTPAG